MTDFPAIAAQACRSLNRQRHAMTRAVHRYHQAPSPGSPYEADRQWLARPGRTADAQRQVYEQGVALLELTAAFVDDHLSATADVLDAAEPAAFAHLTLTRSALEGAARVHYLLAPGQDSTTRLTRFSSLLLGDIIQEQKADAEIREDWHLYPSSLGDQTQDRRAGLEKLVESSGMILQRQRKSIVSVSWGAQGPTAQTSPQLSPLVRKLLPDHPGAYRFGSGAVHAQPWVLRSARAGSARAAPHPSPTAVGASVDLGIAAALRVIEAHAGWLGHDAAPERRQAAIREHAVTRLVAAAIGSAR